MKVQCASISGALSLAFFFLLLLRLLDLLSWQPVLHPPSHAEGGVKGWETDPAHPVGVPEGP